MEIVAPKSLPLNTQEPTCEELRAMWRFSKRQSRAAEMANEIPTYRDPFAYNYWEPYYPTTRSLGRMRLVPRYRDSSRPLYGRVIHREPLARLNEKAAIEDIARMEGENKGITEPRRRVVQFRYAGGSSGASRDAAANNRSNGRIHANFISSTGIAAGGDRNSVASAGSFKKLKELIRTQRARELAQQRKDEEMAARAAVLKEIANGQRLMIPFPYMHILG